MSNELTLRPRTREDDVRILEIYHQWETIFTASLEGFRYHMDERVRPDNRKPDLFVAELNGEIVGDGWSEYNFYSAEPNSYYVGLEVDKAHTKRGFGSQIWAEIERRLGQAGAIKAFASTTEEMAESARFAASHGFEKTGRAERISRLRVADANFNGYEGLIQRLDDNGIVIKTAAEANISDEQFMRELHKTIMEADADIPSTEEFQPVAYEIWRQNFLKNPESSAEAYWIALEHGVPVGVAMLERPAPRRAWNGLTGVRRSARGKGVARALKQRSVEWAAANGIDNIDTGNDAENVRMLAINVQLGYQSLPRREEWLKIVGP